MKKRKTLAVIASDICNDYMNRILIGISRQAKALGYNTVVFLISCNQNDASLIQRGEENIFTMIKKESVDGVILLVGNGSSQKIVNKFKDTFAGWEMPIIAVDYEYDFCDSIYAEDTPLIERMTDHFIEKHGCKKIMCITGPEGNIPAMPRLEGYKRSMKKHGLEIGADDIVFGDFWKIIPKRIAKQIIDGNVERPDAIVCANDVMARTLCNSLVKGGMSIPEDMRISGYDGTDEAVMSIPPITTVCPDNERLGASAVCRLHKAITGAEEEPIESLVGAELLYTSSCGCKDSILSSVVRSEEYNNKVKRFDRQYSQSGMLECLVEDESLDGFLHKLYRHIFLINDLNFYMLCLCKGWDDVEGAEDDYIREGYTDTMESKIVYLRGIADFNSREFNSVDILPEFITEYADEPSMYFLLPVHFMDRCFGYSLFRFGDVRSAISSVFTQWNNNIGTALELLRVRTKLMSINQRIFMNSIRDTLTGVFNRRGFDRLANALFRQARDEQKTFFVLMADLDRLKMINDNFGHIEGDNAITIAANALNKVCEMGAVCARIGGDEYAIVGFGDYYTDEHVENYITYIHGYFDRYNMYSKKEYEVGLSLGYFCGIPEPDSVLEQYIEIADEKMYADKIKRRMQRQN